ncbi:NAPA isoform 10 [Pan troglodytes]|uniref:NAPA isoform 10 n=1 Tax=Pan troglodytes TaxID=9598 RepID=A0A2J8K1R2_PANTR|nr:NAPA isoform 10 [Pan troglodytes]
MDNSGKEAEAMALLAEAERKVKNSQSFFSGLFGPHPDPTERIPKCVAMGLWFDEMSTSCG